MKTSSLLLSCVSIAGLSLVAAAWFSPAGSEAASAVAPSGTVTIGPVTILDAVSSDVTLPEVAIRGTVRHAASKVSHGPAMLHVQGLRSDVTIVHPATIAAHYTFTVEPQI